MQSLIRYLTPPHTCGYLPDRDATMEYDVALTVSPAEYLQRLEQGWRHFGHMMFRPQCVSCRQCQSLRVIVERFRPNRSQRRAAGANHGDVELRIGPPSVSRAKLDLYDRYHAFQSGAKGWPEHAPKDEASYRESYVVNPFPIEEWCYYLHGRLIGVGYVDVLPAGLSAIYFFYDPAERGRSLGTWNVLNVLDRAAQLGVPFVYLGYFVKGCQSLEYKASFTPNQVLGPDGKWHDFRE